MASSDVSQRQFLNGLGEDSHTLKFRPNRHRTVPNDEHLLDPGIRVGQARVHDQDLPDPEASVLGKASA